ncbi:AGAP002853-PA [Anopheles gambiae str. PEST]|uniref:AGAP002853-PA n=1 Tax=Anopheles gambiae TaxID=7165 RepID=A0ND57_ANOGA|nr:uncharacterized protein LOC4577447 [Anopheles gambiae]XP_040226790.2 uncharacterized protein LOC120951874 [Anopheles coluzzii]EAU77074.3 AGAP002853-PA [Anopheles gambiae str. PEST]
MAFWRFAYISLACITLGHEAAANMNFDVHIDKLERVGDTGEYFTYNYSYEKISEMKFNMGAQVQQLKELDDSYTVKALVARADLADGSEFEVMMDLQKPLCEWMRTIYKTYFYEELAKVSNFPHYDTCPLPVANYVMENYVLDTEPYSEMMSEGRWKMEMMLMKGDSVCSGISVLNTVKPKE